MSVQTVITCERQGCDRKTATGYVAHPPEPRIIPQPPSGKWITVTIEGQGFKVHPGIEVSGGVKHFCSFDCFRSEAFDILYPVQAVPDSEAPTNERQTY